ncbi:hypothetical protein B0H11DRAFT_2036687 [Mycena galericulata]|nr:hypothetical protein B0H11DRAFT_2036687 [Mycena galericulata]
MIAAIHLVAHILFVLAFVASAAALIHANNTSYFCGSHWPSHEHGLTPSHTRLPAVGVLSLIVVLSARALRRAVSTSVSWIPVVGAPDPRSADLRRRAGVLTAVERLRGRFALLCFNSELSM